MENYLMGRGAASNDSQDKTICNRRKANIKFEDLPEDVQCTILSKLPLKEVVRASVLSSEWRYLWVNCPKLCFNRAEMSGHKRCMKKFIDTVNAVLQKCRGDVVEEFKVKFGFDTTLADHVNSFISFAASSRVKVLAFDLEPFDSGLRYDHYIFPFDLFNNESISCLQSIQLSFVSLEPPFQFSGFPNLRKLDLRVVHVTRKDLEDTLSSCCNIEWLSMDRCHLKDELKVDTPMFHLQHLRIVHCELTKIEFHAVNLDTFVYKGSFLPIVLNHSRKLDDVRITLYQTIFQHVLAALLDGLPSMKNLTFHIYFPRIEMQGLRNNPYKFSRLRNLQLFMNIDRKDADKLFCLVSFLRAAPLIERLEVHVIWIYGFDPYLWFADVGPERQNLQQYEYKHLKSMYITGYKGARGQLEFILHVVENAPVLEVLTVHTTRAVLE
uniref:F-box domain-containing protein n=1 Tax=Setaria italica TaxID=4555 RepID=K3YMF8_SETIT